MSSSITLIQLISEQTMQNLVPILALKPSHVVHLTTSKTAARSAQIVEAARQAHVMAHLESIRLSDMPSIPETSRAVMRSIETARRSVSPSTPVVNFTGGTKMMSIGAYEAAKSLDVTSLYVDTDHEEFIDGHSGPKLNTILGDDFSFTSFHKSLTVNSIAVANGRSYITEGHNWLPYLPLAKHFMENTEHESISWEEVYGAEGICPGGREPRQARQWLPLLDRPLHLPTQVVELAGKAGLIRIAGENAYLLDTSRSQLESLTNDPNPKDYYQVIRPLQFTLAFLSGGWWEVAVVDAAQRSGQFRDLRWSINVGARQGSYDTEEDVVGVDGVRITYFSCKRGGIKSRLVSQLDELDYRARSMGGHFTRRFLAVYLPLSPHVKTSLKKRARELNGIQILTPENLENPQTYENILR